MEQKAIACVLCGGEQGLPGADRSFKCNPCNSLKSRLHRACLVGFDAKGAFSNFSKTQKQEWFRKNHDTLGTDIPATFNEVVKHTQAKESRNAFIGNGDFMDLEDLEIKYKNKPKQLAAIVRNARSFYCDIRETMLYEDVKYTAVVADEDSTKDSHEAAVAQDRTGKKAKSDAAPKVAKTAKTDGLSEAAKQKLQKVHDECRCWLNELVADLETAKKEDIVGYMAPVAIASATAFKLTLEAFFAEVAGALDGNDFSMTEVKNQHYDLKQDFKETIGRLRENVQDAEGYVAAIAEGKAFSKRKAVKGNAKEVKAKDVGDVKPPKAKKAKTEKKVKEPLKKVRAVQ